MRPVPRLGPQLAIEWATKKQTNRTTSRTNFEVDCRLADVPLRQKRDRPIREAEQRPTSSTLDSSWAFRPSALFVVGLIYLVFVGSLHSVDAFKSIAKVSSSNGLFRICWVCFKSPCRLVNYQLDKKTNTNPVAFS